MSETSEPTPDPVPATGEATREATRAATAGGPTAEDRPLTKGERAFYQFARLTFILFGRLFWRVSVEGQENVPTDRPFIVSPVHRSNIDTILMAFVSKRHMRYMAKDSLWRYGWSGRLITALGGFPVNRDTADRDALRTCESALRRGEPVVIFPEGTRRSGPVITDLFQGAAFVAMRGGVPIIPVGIGGSAGAMPKGSKFLHPVKIRIIIGTPIQPPVREGAGARGSRRHVHELTDRLHVELQQLFDRAEGRPTAAGTGTPATG